MYNYTGNHVCLILHIAAATLDFVDSVIEVMEESDAMVEVCVELDNIAAGVTLGCDITVTVDIQDGPAASMFIYVQGRT